MSRAVWVVERKVDGRWVPTRAALRLRDALDTRLIALENRLVRYVPESVGKKRRKKP